MPTALVTGASSGIGWATAIEFARNGFDVVVVARRKELLSKLLEGMPKGNHRAEVCDVSQWSQVEALSSRVSNLNVLVNNAGAFEYASLEKSVPEKLEEMINVNLRGVIYMCKAFLPQLKASAQAGQSSKIVNISSIGGLWGFSNMAVYTATKFAVTGFSSALRRELAKQKIDVASIHPGPVRNREVESKTPKKAMTMLPDQVARQIFDLARSKNRRRISHPLFSMLNLLENLSPATVDKVLKKIL